MLIPIRKFSLPDGPVHFSASGDGRRFVVCTSAGKCWLLDDDLMQTAEIEVGRGVEWVHLDDTGSMLLVGRAAQIDGYPMSSSTPRFTLPISGTSHPCCVFNSDEDVLCVASWDRSPTLSAWSLGSSTLIAEAALPDRGGAGYFLLPHPEGEAMAIVAYSGQSEEWMFWATYSKGRLRVYEQPEVLDVSLPCFHPTGREFVSHHEELGLCRMKFPSAELIASVRPEEAFSNEDIFSYYIHFFRDDRFLAWQEGCALYEFDLATLRPTQTVLSGADGKTFGEGHFFSGQSWQLARGRLLTSDTLHDRTFKHRTSTLRLWDASMLCGHVSPGLWDASMLCGQLTPPDPARPYTRQLTG